MIETGAVRGRSVIVAGAGLAGLAAAVDLDEAGAQVTVVEARDRVGGRVWTIHHGWSAGQHAEAGGDLIDEGQEAITRLVSRMGLELTPILRGGFSFVRQDHDRRAVVQGGESGRYWAQLRKRLEPWVRDYRLADQRWDSVIAQTMARVSAAEWLQEIGAEDELRAFVLGMRGFFLADPADLSLLALVDQLASATPGSHAMYRINGGNDQLADRLASRLGDRIHLRTVLLGAAQTADTVRVTVQTPHGGQERMEAQYLIVTLPATTVRALAFDPPLPALQRDAVHQLRYGPATRTLLQFERRFWQGTGRPYAYGTDLFLGAMWDGNEEQGGREGILSLLAGGSASTDTLKIMATHGVKEIVASLDWLGAANVPLRHSHMISWTEDPWACGGYAYFDPDYDAALRPWLARPHGRILFAGEHTSSQWQGYMNGAVESGLRAVGEVRAFVRAGQHRRTTR